MHWPTNSRSCPQVTFVTPRLLRHTQTPHLLVFIPSKFIEIISTAVSLLLFITNHKCFLLRNCRYKSTFEAFGKSLQFGRDDVQIHARPSHPFSSPKCCIEWWPLTAISHFQNYWQVPNKLYRFQTVQTGYEWDSRRACSKAWTSPNAVSFQPIIKSSWFLPIRECRNEGEHTPADKKEGSRTKDSDKTGPFSVSSFLIESIDVRYRVIVFRHNPQKPLYTVAPLYPVHW